MTQTTQNLTGKLLVAMPGMGDPRFEQSVIYLCAHSNEGAMGLIINKPAKGLAFTDLLDQLDIPTGPATSAIKVHFGGPVENGRGFVLHSSDYETAKDTLKVDGNFGMTATLDILEDLAKGFGPQNSLLALGYAGWAPGQLEEELLQNGWLICDAAPDLVFDASDTGKWTAALGSLGIAPHMLSAQSGRA
ncbi:MAG: YqgE/AlgH family protein [Planktomarina sp.]